MGKQGDEPASPELRDRAVRSVLDKDGHCRWRWQAVRSISAKIGRAHSTVLGFGLSG